MPMSPYMASIRDKIGKQLIEIPSVSVLTFDDEGRDSTHNPGSRSFSTMPGATGCARTSTRRAGHPTNLPASETGAASQRSFRCSN